eukprot:12496871-Alexandrium_andersonii.AAC.1
MSASLVGSEMCIRDRRTPRGQDRPRRGVRIPTAASRGRHADDTNGSTSCLLYTSDAADDM